MSASGGLLVGNLDCEEEWAALEGGGSGTVHSPSRAARRAASGAATLLRAFAGERTVLWTLEALAPGRLADVPGLPRPRLVSGRSSGPRGAGPEGGAGGPVLAWGETPSVGALRRRIDVGGARRAADIPSGLPASGAALWTLPPPDPRVAARLNHRAFSLEIARELGLAFPAARMIGSVEELARHWAEHLDRGVLDASAEAWVAKAPLSAAGRDRVLGRGLEDLRRGEVRRRLANLLERRGALRVEPWVARSADFGCAALVEPRRGAADAEGRAKLVGVHRLEVDPAGRFTGIELLAGGGSPPGLARPEEGALVRTVEEVGRRLARAGYVGPFGLDAYRWRDPGGTEHFQPLGEINARLTFGLVARALVDRMRDPLGLGPEDRVALRFGRELPRTHGGRADGDGVVPLVLPGDGGAGELAAWLDLG